MTGGWPPGSVPPPQQPGAVPGQPPFMGQQPPVSVPYSNTQAFQSPPGAPVYQYTTSPPGAPQQPPPANGQVPQNPTALAQAVPNTVGYTASTYASPAAPQAPPARPGYQEFTGMFGLCTETICNTHYRGSFQCNSSIASLSQLKS